MENWVATQSNPVISSICDLPFTIGEGGSTEQTLNNLLMRHA